MMMMVDFKFLLLLYFKAYLRYKAHYDLFNLKSKSTYIFLYLLFCCTSLHEAFWLLYNKMAITRFMPYFAISIMFATLMSFLMRCSPRRLKFLKY